MDKVKNYPPYLDYLDYQKQYKPQTNADRIRAMSDEELAKQLVFMSTICEFCVKRKNCEDVPGYEHCMEGILDWLYQPAEGE